MEVIAGANFTYFKLLLVRILVFDAFIALNPKLRGQGTQRSFESIKY